MIQYSELENEGSFLKPQPTIREVTNSIFHRCNTSHLKILLTFVAFVGLVIALGHSMGLQPDLVIEVVMVKGDEIVHTTSEKFVSVALDTSIIQERWAHLNLSDPKFIQRAKIFSPGYLRVGGTAADKLIFRENVTEEDEQQTGATFELMDGGKWAYEDIPMKKNFSNFTMTGDDWVRINKFAEEAGLSLLFDLNVLLRRRDAWNGSNAKELIRFSDEHGFDVAWQLGNEPNSFPHVFHTNISGKQLGKDFSALRKMLQSVPRYANATLVGPDVTRPKFIADSPVKYLKEFLKSAGEVVNAVTWHQYYFYGKGAYLEDFINTHTFNLLYKQILAVKLAVSDVFNGTEKVPIWLSETGSAYGGGAPNLSNRFVASFMWLDKLGISAQMGIDVVVRQSLFHGYYALLEDRTFKPFPDWWISLLYKKLVGHRVLQTSSFTGAVRLYCHCTPLNVTGTSRGTATLFGMNLLEDPANVVVKGLPAPAPHSRMSAYVLTGGGSGRLSKKVMLNGERLWFQEDGSLPPFEPQLINYDRAIQMPPYSIGFFVLHGISVPACN